MNTYSTPTMTFPSLVWRLWWLLCPKCGSDNTEVAVTPNSFGDWKCHACNACGSYPPEAKP